MKNSILNQNHSKLYKHIMNNHFIFNKDKFIYLKLFNNLYL